MITKGINFPPAVKRVMSKMPLMIGCREFEEFIVAYFEDELTSRQRFIFDMHLRVCRECREYLRAYEAAMTLAKGAGEARGDDLPEVPEDLVAAVVDALKEDNDTHDDN